MAERERATAEIRQDSARRCLLALREAEGPLSMAELVALAGLSRPTVESVLAELRSRGLVEPAAPGGDGGPGRPARRFALVPAAAHLAALDLGARHVRGVLTDLTGAVVGRSTVALEGTDPVVALREALAALGEEPDAVGLAVPGLLGPDGAVVDSLVLPSLAGRDLSGELAAQIGAPVVAENDVKLAAFAEHRIGPGVDSLVLVRLGHRVSVAIMAQGQILQGAHRLAGELGTQRGMRWTATSHRGRLVWSTGDEAKPLLERAAAGEQAARAEITAFCEEIAPRLAGLLLAVDPELVVVGGGLSHAGETLLAPLRTAVGRQLMLGVGPRIVPATLPDQGALVGALGLVGETASPVLVGVPQLPAPWARLRRLAPDRSPYEGTP